MQTPSDNADTHETILLDSDPTGQTHRLFARSLWATLVVFTATIFFASLPLYLAQLQTTCVNVTCQYNQLTPEQAETLSGIGLSLGLYAALTLALMIAMFVVCLVVSALIVWRRSDDWMALLVALMLVALGPIIGASSLASGPMLWQTLNQGLTFLLTALLLVVFAIFPSGQFVPRWMRWPLVILLIVEVPLTFFPAAGLMTNTAVSQPGWLVTLVGLAGVAFAQGYRYRRVSNLLQRQQTKWVVFGLAAPIATLAGVSVLTLVFPALTDRGSFFPLLLSWSSFPLICVPLGFGFAIMRYRLWDIDALINKALVYGSLTVLLAGVYAGLIVGLQSLATLTRGDIANKPVALVISTLATVALVQPVRRRLQALIDRRFYRRKYDAAKTLAAFSATLHGAMDLDTLRVQVLDVVQETMQPAQVSLWLSRRAPHTTG
jgi:hypothetical protein